MNPFDLRGPEFLVLYCGLGTLTVITVWLLRHSSERGAPPGPMLNDYLEIAYLRGGSNEALRVATMNLINRGLIDVKSDDSLQTVDRKAAARVTRSAERGILEKFQVRDMAPAIFADRRLKDAAREDCEPALVRLGLLPDGGGKTFRTLLLFAAVFVLVAVAGIKILVALSRGRSNVLFLIAEAVIFCVLAFKVTHPFRTRAGNALLGDLQTLFAGLQGRAGSLMPGVQTEDFALLAAVFGVAVLPARFSFDRLFPKAQTTSSCGSGCGSDSGSGGSCGGGSCGGGCGGCGS